jgi:hypothetical protein
MDKRDKMVIFVGIFILIIALIGVMYEEKEYTEAREEEKKIKYAVTWEEDTGGFKEAGTAMRGEATTITVPITQEGLMHVEFTLEWSDTLSTGILIPWNWSDMLEIAVDAPGTSEFSSNPVGGYTSPLILTATLGEKPGEMRVNATNETELHSIISSYITTDGVGDWNADITIQPKPFIFDRGNDFTLTVTYTYYTPLYRELS